MSAEHIHNATPPASLQLEGRRLKAFPRFFWLLLAAGLALRLLVIHARPEGTIYRAPDEDEFILLARSVAHGDGFALHGQTTAYRDMLMPVTTGLLMGVFGDSPLPMLYLNVLLSCATALLIVDLGRRRFSRTTALIMGGLWLFYPGAILISGMLFTETLFVFWWTLSLVLHDRLEESEYGIRYAILLGLVSGLAMLTRAVGAVLPVAYTIYIVLIRFETARAIRLRAAAVMVAASLVVILPWMIRNEIAVGRFALNTNGGINMFIGNNPRANGSYKFDEQQESLLPPESAGEAARDRAAAGLALAFMRQHPQETVKLWGKKFAFLWATDVTQLIHYFWNPNGPPHIPERLRVLPVSLLILLGLPYMLIVGFGISGYYLIRHFATRGLFLLQIFLATLAVFLSFGTPRFHFPFMPALVVGAGALYRPKVWSSAPQWRRLFLLFTLGLFGGMWLFEAMVIAGV